MPHPVTGRPGRPRARAARVPWHSGGRGRERPRRCRRRARAVECSRRAAGGGGAAAACFACLPACCCVRAARRVAAVRGARQARGASAACGSSHRRGDAVAASAPEAASRISAARAAGGCGQRARRLRPLVRATPPPLLEPESAAAALARSEAGSSLVPLHLRRTASGLAADDAARAAAQERARRRAPATRQNAVQHAQAGQCRREIVLHDGSPRAASDGSSSSMNTQPLSAQALPLARCRHQHALRSACWCCCAQPQTAESRRSEKDPPQRQHGIRRGATTHRRRASHRALRLCGDAADAAAAQQGLHANAAGCETREPGAQDAASASALGADGALPRLPPTSIEGRCG